MSRTIARGELYFTDLGQGRGSEQEGRRPVVIIQNDAGNRNSSTVIVAAISSQISRRSKLPTHAFLGPENGLDAPSVVLLEQLRTVDKERLLDYIGQLSQSQMAALNKALSVSVGLERPKPKNLTLCLCRTCASDFHGSGAYFLKRTDPIQVELELCTYCNRRLGYTYEILPRRREQR